MKGKLLVLFTLFHLNYATISVDQSGEVAVCPGGSVTITFTHPTLGGDSGYLPSMMWRRNGSDYVPDGLFEEVSTTSTKTTLTITCGGDFPFGSTYQAFIFNQITKGREFSEVVTIIAKVPNKVAFRDPDVSQSTITVKWEPVSSECDQNMTYNVSCPLCTDNHQDVMETENQCIFNNLYASTEYIIEAVSCYGVYCSEPEKMAVTTNDVDASGSNKGVSWIPIVIAVIVLCITLFISIAVSVIICVIIIIRRQNRVKGSKEEIV